MKMIDELAQNIDRLKREQPDLFPAQQLGITVAEALNSLEAWAKSVSDALIPIAEAIAAINIPEPTRWQRFTYRLRSFFARN